MLNPEHSFHSSPSNFIHSSITNHITPPLTLQPYISCTRLVSCLPNLLPLNCFFCGAGEVLQGWQMTVWFGRLRLDPEWCLTLFLRSHLGVLDVLSGTDVWFIDPLPHHLWNGKSTCQIGEHWLCENVKGLAYNLQNKIFTFSLDNLSGVGLGRTVTVMLQCCTVGIYIYALYRAHSMYNTLDKSTVTQQKPSQKF